jgi:putative DNA primase/helicase
LNKKQVEFTMNDQGNAKVFLDRFGHELRRVHAKKCWYEWDGKRWVRDDSGNAGAFRRADKLISDWVASEDRDLSDWGLKCGSTARINALLEFASMSEEVSATPDDLDRDPLVLNTLSGIVDLRTGEVTPHNRLEMCTKMCPFEVAESSSDSPVWDKFLLDITLGDKSLETALLSWLGYCLTGLTSQQKFAMGIGKGRNGKSTLAALMAKLMGDYAGDMPTQFLLTSKIEKPTSGLEVLRGKRFVVAEEPDRKRDLDREFIKRFISGEPMQVAQKFERPYDMAISAKLFLMANHKPQVEFDFAFSRRVLVFPFEHSVPEHEVNLRLLDELLEEAPAILRSLVDACVLQQQQGLAVSEKMTEALSAYQDDFDPAQAFLDERCIVDEFGSVGASALLQAYNGWARTNKEREVDARRLKEMMTIKGYACKRIGADRTRSYEGLTIRGDHTGQEHWAGLD